MEPASMEGTSGGDPIEFLDAVVRYETRLWAAVERRLAEEHLPGLGRIWAMRSIRRHGGGARVLDLHRDLGITTGAVSRFVDRLVLDGFVVRGPHPDDRRSSTLTLSAAGDAALDRGLETTRAALGRALPDDGSVQRVRAGLRLLDEQLTERTP